MTLGELRHLIVEAQRTKKLDEDDDRSESIMLSPWVPALLSAIESVLEQSMSQLTSSLTATAMIEGLPHPVRADDIEWFAEEIAKMTMKEAYHLNDVVQRTVSRTVKRLHKRTERR